MLVMFQIHFVKKAIWNQEAPNSIHVKRYSDLDADAGDGKKFKT